MNKSNPLVSVIIFTYNQEQYIKQTLEGAFAQTYSPLEIIISDDCSTDANFEIIQQEVSKYTGPHNIILNRNQTNLGVGDHVNYALKLSKGDLIVMMGGDDVSFPERTATIFDEWISSDKSIMAFFSNVELIDQDGNHKGKMFDVPPEYTEDIHDFIRKAKSFKFKSEPLCWLLGCSEAIDRRLLDCFDDIDNRVIQEDAVLAFRALLLGKIKYIDKILVKYRRHGDNIFQPNDVNKVIHLLKSEFYYKLQWYNDSLKINGSPKSLIPTLKLELRKGYLFHIFIKTPIVGIGYQNSKKVIKRLIKFGNK
jgi:glycosyltransferase involved in cell wall biosynthesis